MEIDPIRVKINEKASLIINRYIDNDYSLEDMIKDLKIQLYIEWSNGFHEAAVDKGKREQYLKLLEE